MRTHAVRQRLRRLRHMGVSELASRARQGTARLIDRARTEALVVRPLEHMLASTPRPRELQAVREGFAALAAERFFPGARDRTLVPLLEERFPGHCASTRAEAEAIVAGTVDLLGYRGVRLDAPVDWHRDAASGVRAPLSHWTCLDPLDFTAVGDSKVTWELNRHQWLVTLAQAHVLTGEPRLARRIGEHLSDWTRANPYGLGINWTSSLEVAYRLISWCWLLVLLREPDGSPSRLLDDLLPQIWTHARHVERYLSIYFSPNTHLTGEALGLFYAGVLFPEFEAAARWREQGARILVEESERQIAGDGVYFEQSLHYQRYTIEIYLQFLLLARRNGLAVPGQLAGRVAQLIDHLVHMGQSGGRLPAIGDTDGGSVLPLARRPPDDARGVCALGAAHFGRPEFAFAAGGPSPEVAWLLGRAGVAACDALSTAPPAGPPSRAFPQGGYVVMRDGWHAGAHRLVVDVGPLGCPVSGAHGHADLLSVTCSAFGEDFLVDPGTYCYTTSQAWRDHFRSTAAHNTLTVDGEGQARPAGPFAWESRPAATLRAWRSTGGYDFVDAEHEAYARPGRRVVHRRRVLFVKPHGWVIVDDVGGGTAHRLALHFQFSPRKVTLFPEGAFAAGGDGAGLWLLPLAAAPMRAALHAGSVDPIAGWVSLQYGERQPAPAICYELTRRLPARIVTVLLPVGRSDPSGPPRVHALRGDAGEIVGLHSADLDATLRVHDTGMALTRGAGPTWDIT